MNWLMELDGNALLWIQEYLRNDFLNPIMKVITTLGDAGFIWILFAVIMLCFKKTRKVGIMVAMALIGSLIINNLILKNLFHRTRPYEVIEGLVNLVGKQSDFSFPSGHTGSSIAAALVMVKMLPKKFGIPALILGILISFSRLYVGVHYPTDVIVGAITGAISALLSIKIYYLIANRKKEVK